MSDYYNDNDPDAAEWLRGLIREGHLPPGDVDQRDMREVTADDIRGYRQCHFFAGVGGWPLALKWAGWEGPAWTGSCPCQPFSNSGKKRADKDERNLWPAFRALIEVVQPSVCFGEQVTGELGRAWMCAVRADFEELGYACGCANLSAAGIGAPHIRQRHFWVGSRGMGFTDGERLQADCPTDLRSKAGRCGRREGGGGSGTAYWRHK